MQKKIFSLLVLLMTAVSGAWADNYYLVGTMNDWGASKQFLLTPNPGNAAEYMITLNLKAGTELKVIGVNSEATTWYPSEGGNYTVTDAGKYTVYFRPDGQGADDWYYHCIYVAAAPAPAIPVTDLGDNQWQFEMPGYAVVAKIEYDTELELQEENVNTTVLADWDGYEADVTLKRTLTAGMWNTFAVPFDVDATTLAAINAKLALMSGSMTVKELTGSSFENGTLTLNFATATSIKAGTPYLVKVTPAAVNLATMPFTGAEVSKTAVTVETTAVDFVPTLGLTKVTGDAKEILFLGTGNTLLYPETLPGSMKGFRAYFKLKGDAAAARSFSLNLGDETTGIISIEHGTLNIDHSVYDLQGRRIDNSQFTIDNTQLKKGVYIVNGKKVIK